MKSIRFWNATVASNDFQFPPPKGEDITWRLKFPYQATLQRVQMLRMQQLARAHLSLQ
jgi:hypothetical protein